PLRAPVRAWADGRAAVNGHPRWNAFIVETRRCSPADARLTKAMRHSFLRTVSVLALPLVGAQIFFACSDSSYGQPSGTTAGTGGGGAGGSGGAGTGGTGGGVTVDPTVACKDLGLASRP